MHKTIDPQILPLYEEMVAEMRVKNYGALKDWPTDLVHFSIKHITVNERKITAVLYGHLIIENGNHVIQEQFEYYDYLYWHSKVTDIKISDNKS